MAIITKALAASIEKCIKQSHVNVTKCYDQGSFLEIAGGAACYSGKDSFLSQVIAWGFKTDKTNFLTEIKAIETFYQQHGAELIAIELCPFVGHEIAEQLSLRSYHVSELNTISILDLTSYHPATIKNDPIVIKIVPNEDLTEWSRCIAIGFGCPKAEEQFYYYAKAQNITAYGAYKNDKIIAGGTIALHTDTCDLGVTSTLPAFRGQGLQKALLIQRLRDAKKAGATLATVTTEPGSISDLNVQKIGFHSAYTRIKFNLTFSAQ